MKIRFVAVLMASGLGVAFAVELPQLPVAPPLPWPAAPAAMLPLPSLPSAALEPAAGVPAGPLPVALEVGSSSGGITITTLPPDARGLGVPVLPVQPRDLPGWGLVNPTVGYAITTARGLVRPDAIDTPPVQVVTETLDDETARGLASPGACRIVHPIGTARIEVAYRNDEALPQAWLDMVISCPPQRSFRISAGLNGQPVPRWPGALVDAGGARTAEVALVALSDEGRPISEVVHRGNGSQQSVRILFVLSDAREAAAPPRAGGAVSIPAAELLFQEGA